ncbi:hypothetical protein AUO95_04750 [Corynebacterium glutamicum]|nr:hypothetical protein AUO95_04750 [Corynebacterium glutamicum]
MPPRLGTKQVTGNALMNMQLCARIVANLSARQIHSYPDMYGIFKNQPHTNGQEFPENFHQ